MIFHLFWLSNPNDIFFIWILSLSNFCFFQNKLYCNIENNNFIVYTFSLPNLRYASPLILCYTDSIINISSNIPQLFYYSIYTLKHKIIWRILAWWCLTNRITQRVLSKNSPHLDFFLESWDVLTIQTLFIISLPEM